jgi:hypothetical protein
MQAIKNSADGTQVEGFQEQVEEHLERLTMLQEELETKVSYRPEASRAVTPVRQVKELMLPRSVDPAIVEMIEKMRREMESKRRLTT